jgi:hypothetical protein
VHRRRWSYDGRVVDALEAAAIPYMLVGSFASTWHGAPRTTQDIDIVIDPTPDGLDRLLADLGADDVYVSPSAHDAPAARDQFNVIDAAAGWKVDLIVRKDRAFSRTTGPRSSTSPLISPRPGRPPRPRRGAARNADRSTAATSGRRWPTSSP